MSGVTNLKLNDKVIIHKPTEKNEAWLSSMDKFDGMETTISKECAKNNVKKGIVGKQHFQCKGCVSELGVPFNFSPEWLERV